MILLFCIHFQVLSDPRQGDTALRFILKTLLSDRELVGLGHQPVVTLYAALRDGITARVGADAARLFAEPIITWPTPESAGSISWYADAEDEARTLESVPTERRERVAADLRAALARLLPLRGDPELGGLLTGALTLADPESIRAVGERAVFVEWGLLPAGAAQDAAGLQKQFAATLLPYVSEPGRAGPSARPGPSSRPAVPAMAAAVAIGPARPDAAVAHRWLLPAAIATAAFFVALGGWISARAVPAVAPVVDQAAVRDAVARREAENTALEAQIETARRSLADNLCAAGPARLPAEVPAETPIPPAMRPPAPAGGTPFQGSLVQLLRQATVLILVPQAHGLALGSGFFIGPKLVATNRHVVEQAGPDGILVVNQLLGRPMHANVQAITPSSEIYQPDIAVLQVPDAPAVQPLSFTRTVEQLDAVVAAGFPGAVLHGDDGFARLLHGDLAAMPSVILSRAVVAA